MSLTIVVCFLSQACGNRVLIKYVCSCTYLGENISIYWTLILTSDLRSWTDMADPHPIGSGKFRSIENK